MDTLRAAQVGPLPDGISFPRGGQTLRVQSGGGGSVTSRRDQAPRDDSSTGTAHIFGVDFLSLADDPVARAEIHDDWSFEIHGINGPRRLKLLRAPAGWMFKGIYDNGGDVSDARLLFGGTAQSMSDVDVVLTNRVTEVVGMVMDDRGRPFSDVTVVAFATDQTLWYSHSRFVGHTDVISDGTFSLRELPPGAYYLVGINKRNTADVSGEIDNPGFLQALAADATRVTVMDRQHSTVSLRVSR